MAVELGINPSLANGADDNTTIGTLEVWKHDLLQLMMFVTHYQIQI